MAGESKTHTDLRAELKRSRVDAISGLRKATALYADGQYNVGVDVHRNALMSGELADAIAAYLKDHETAHGDSITDADHDNA